MIGWQHRRRVLIEMRLTPAWPALTTAVMPVTAPSAAVPHALPMAASNPFSSSPAWRVWVLAIASAGLGLWGALLLLSSVARHGDLKPIFERPSAEPAAPQPTEYPEMVDLAGSNAVAVYSCGRDGARVYSDRPCGPEGSTQTIDIDGINTYSPPAMDRRPVAARSTIDRGGVPRDGAAAEADDELHEGCASIAMAIERLNARMRAGYTSAEGEVYRKRWHQLKDDFHEAGCTWHTR